MEQEKFPQSKPAWLTVGLIAQRLQRREFSRAHGGAGLDFHPGRRAVCLSQRNVVPLLKANLIEMTIPDKPRSSKQKYRLSEKGRHFLAEAGSFFPFS
jgi:hypothetical protein